MKPTVRVRLAAASDAATISKIGAQSFRETFAAYNSAADMQAYISANFRPDVQSRELADASVLTFLAEVGSEKAGYAQLRAGEAPECVRETPAIEIVRIYALARYHDQGVGSALMRACLHAAQQLGARSVWLGVWERNHRAIAFYQRFGFVECGDHVFVLGADPQRDVIMAHNLSR